MTNPDAPVETTTQGDTTMQSTIDNQQSTINNHQSPIINSTQSDRMRPNAAKIRACARSVYTRPHAHARGTHPGTRPRCAACTLPRHSRQGGNLPPNPSIPAPKPHHSSSPFVIPALLPRHSREGGNLPPSTSFPRRRESTPKPHHSSSPFVISRTPPTSFPRRRESDASESNGTRAAKELTSRL